MNSENTSKLLAAYPLLYRKLRNQDFECGDGWFDLVWQVSAEIESAALLEGIPKSAEAWPSVGILKQKFGALRVQFDRRVSERMKPWSPRLTNDQQRPVNYAVRLRPALTTHTDRAAR